MERLTSSDLFLVQLSSNTQEKEQFLFSHTTLFSTKGLEKSCVIVSEGHCVISPLSLFQRVRTLTCRVKVSLELKFHPCRHQISCVFSIILLTTRVCLFLTGDLCFQESQVTNSQTSGRILFQSLSLLYELPKESRNYEVCSTQTCEKCESVKSNTPPPEGQVTRIAKNPLRLLNRSLPYEEGVGLARGLVFSLFCLGLGTRK